MDASSKGKRVAFNGADRSVYDGPFEATTELVALGGQGYNSGGRLGEVMTNPMPGPSEIAICVTLFSMFSASLLVSLCGGSRACDDPRENTGRGGLASLMALGYAEARVTHNRDCPHERFSEVLRSGWIRDGGLPAVRDADGALSGRLRHVSRRQDAEGSQLPSVSLLVPPT
jgi:hypothetical protein